MPVPKFAEPVAPSLYRQALRIVNGNRRAMLLPLLVTQAPVAIIGAISTFLLYYHFYPDSTFGSVEALQEDPAGLLFTLWLMNGIYWLFTLVGLAATMVAANAIIAGKQIGLATSLDPAFTRMGGLLGLGFIYYVFAILTAIIIPAIFFLIRFGLTMHAFILDGEPLGKALKSSWMVLRGRMLKLTGLLLGFLGLMTIALFIVGVVLAITSTPLLSNMDSRDTELVNVALLLGAGGLLVVPLGSFFMTTLTLFYLREKSEKKGRGLA